MYLPTQSGNVLSHVCRSLQTSSRSEATVSGNTKFGSQTKFKTCSVLWTKLTCDGIGGSMQPKAVTKQMGILLRELKVRWSINTVQELEWNRYINVLFLSFYALVYHILYEHTHIVHTKSTGLYHLILHSIVGNLSWDVVSL